MVGTNKQATQTYTSLLNKVMSAPMLYFEVVPTGSTVHTFSESLLQIESDSVYAACEFWLCAL